MGEIDTNNDKDKGVCKPRIKMIAVYEPTRELTLNPPSNITSFSCSRTNCTQDTDAQERVNKSFLFVSDKSPFCGCLCAKSASEL